MVHALIVRRMRARTFIAGLLVLLFAAIFVFRIESSRIGPYTSEERDDIGITDAYIDLASEILYLVTSECWTQIDLVAIRRQNTQFQYTVVPRSGNFLHWRGFKGGRPELDLSRLVPVAVCTSDFASFNYKWDGHPRQNHDHATQPPDGFQYALFRSDSEVAEDNRTWFKSYLLQTPAKGDDDRFGVQFFYHPDTRYRVAFQHPMIFALFGPSFVALCIALPLAFSGVRIGPATALFMLAALLHLVSFAFFLGGVRYGEAWSGYSSAHNSPYVHLILGLGVLFALFLVRLSREATKCA